MTTPQMTTPARWCVKHVTGHGSNDFAENLAVALKGLPVLAQRVSVSHSVAERAGGTFYSAVIAYWLPAARFI